MIKQVKMQQKYRKIEFQDHNISHVDTDDNFAEARDSNGSRAKNHKGRVSTVRNNYTSP